MQLQLSFDLRRPDFASAVPGALYAAMLDICEWADDRGFERVFFGEHHSAEDGYLPAPLLACAAAAGRTRHLRFRPILLTPLYDPLRLAEDIAVVDLLSAGRIEPLLAAGYRPAEFAMFDRPSWSGDGWSTTRSTS
jgi:alkanesulfonate monooxygenase SsuD/methylene tetrahydromethanopterin reductase-like flavin-dependent oxidoreductase (luciferase family)